MISSGNFLKFGPAKPHQCSFPDSVPTGERGPAPEISWPAAWRLPRTGDEWQCGQCARVYRYRSGGWFREGRWRFLHNPGHQIPLVPVSNKVPAPPPRPRNPGARSS